MSGSSSVWMIYDHPRSNPKAYVARRFNVSNRGLILTEDMITSNDIDKLRIWMVMIGTTPMAPQNYFDPKILEGWE